MNSSVLWISSPTFEHTDAVVDELRKAGLLPLRVESADRALRLLQHFRVGLVVHHASAPGACVECARLAATRSPLLVLLAHLDSAERYLFSGCAAVVADSCPPDVLVQMVQEVITGKRGLTWPQTLAPDVAAAR